MKFTKLRLVGATDVDLPIVGADPSGAFVLKSADGLGPTEVGVSIAETTQEGGLYQGRKAQNRQVVMRVGLQPEWDIGQTPEELRTDLYGLLTPKFGQLVRMEVVDVSDDVLAKAQGHLSKMEVALFSETPEVQITLDCDHPYLLAPVLKYQIPAEVVVADQTILDVVNEGTAPSGFTMGITFTAPTAVAIQIADDDPFGERMDISGSWAAGDTLIVDTRSGTRGIWKIPSGGSVPASILDNLSGLSTWLQLHGGLNKIRVNNTSFDWHLVTGFGHTPAYWGV